MAINWVLGVYCYISDNVWLTWLGVQDPLHFFSSVKGAAHGYTLIQIGGVTALYSMSGALIFLFRLIRLGAKPV